MSNLLGPRDANGIPVPMTVDESIASDHAVFPELFLFL